MLTKCANPVCAEEFFSLRHGRLFVLDAQPHRPEDKATTRPSQRRQQLEYFWLCDRCCKSMRVAIDQEHRVYVIHVNPPAAPAASEGLASLQRAVNSTPSRSDKRQNRRPSRSWTNGATTPTSF